MASQPTMPTTLSLLSEQPGHAPPAHYLPPPGGHQPGASHYAVQPNPGNQPHSYPNFPSALMMSQAPNGTPGHLYQYGQAIPYPTPQRLQDGFAHLQARLKAQETANMLHQACLEAQETAYKMHQERMESVTQAQQERLVQQDRIIKDLQTGRHSKSAKEKTARTSGVVRGLIHKIMLRLLGVAPIRKGKLPALPHPLNIGEPRRKAADGTELHNPDWLVGMLAPSSQSFIEMAATLALQQEQTTPVCSLPPEAVTLKTFEVPAKQYFTQLRQTYKGQNSPGTRRRQDIHQTQSRRRSRKSQKVDMCRTAIPTITDRHGEENVIGIENIFETDNMTSEYSQDEGGQLSEDSWAEHKAKYVKGNTRAFEQHRKMWKSSQHCHLQMYAFSIGREIALAEDGKGRELAQITRFPCDDRNISDDPPKAKRPSGRPVYEKCVSQSWLMRTRNPMVLEATPPSFTIFNLVIPDERFRPRDLEYLQEHEELEKRLKAEAERDAEEAADDEGGAKDAADGEGGEQEPNEEN